MSKSFKIVISTISLVSATWFIFLGREILLYPWITLRVIVGAFFPFLVLLMVFVGYSYYKVLNGNDKFYFYFLNIFGIISIFTFLYSNIAFISR